MIHSKSKSVISARRTRGSEKTARRVLKTSAVMPAGRSDVEFGLHDPAVVDGVDIVGVGPAAGIVFESQIDGAGLEGFEHHRRIAEIVEADFVEVEAAAIDGKIASPIVLIASE